MYKWRSFQFFEKQIVKEPGTNDQKLFKKDNKQIEICCTTSGRGFLILGDLEGGVHVIDRDLNKLYSFSAYARFVTHLEQAKQKNILVSLGSDEENISPTVKFWNLDNVEDGQYPELIRIMRLPMGIAATCSAINSDLSQFVVGLCDGTIIMVVGDPLRDRSQPKTLVIKQGFPITGLGFCEDGQHKHSKATLYVVTTDHIVALESTINQGITKADTLDDKGCDIGCSVVNPYNDLVVGRKEAIYFYHPQGKGPCRAFDGERKMLAWFRNYLIVVDQSATSNKNNIVTIYHLPATTSDIENKFIAYSGNFQNIAHVVCEWNQIFVIERDGSIFRLVEKDTQTKLEMLFSRRLYQVAIEMALSNNCDTNALVDILREYGDHLYDKGDYNGAMEQYIKTIGYDGLEPSYVIKKFLDAQCIHNLTLYLEKLHEKNCANANHTTLLLNCYTKLKDSKKLNEFIKQPDLDVETAIRVCRQANYHEEALELADRHKAYHWYIKILLEDLHRDKEALEYIKGLPFHEAEENLKKYGKDLVATLPEETTQFLIRLCTDYQKKVVSQELVPPKEMAGQFIHIFVNQSHLLIRFLEYICEYGQATPVIYNTLLELYLREDGNDKDERREKAMELLRKPESYDSGHALVLCQMHDFKRGQLFLLEKMQMYTEIVQYYMDNHEYENVVRACNKYAKNDTSLWVKALGYFCNNDPNKCKQEILDVLRKMEQNPVLPPLQVIKQLAQFQLAHISLVKSYITKAITRDISQISEDTRELRKLQEETKRNKEEIKLLKSGPKIFQIQKCSQCQVALDLPAVHFLCNHSFHQRCLGENESECPSCAEENKNFRTRLRDMEQNTWKHNEFFRQLEGSTDKFSVVAKYFGYGLFNKASNSEAMDIGLPSIDPHLLKDLDINFS